MQESLAERDVGIASLSGVGKPWAVGDLRVRLEGRQGFCRHPRHMVIEEDWFRRTITDFDLWYCRSGRERMRDASGREILFERGDVLLLMPGDVWTCLPAPGTHERWEMMYVHFDLLDSTTGQRVAKERLQGIETFVHCYDPDFVENTFKRILKLSHSWKHCVGQTTAYHRGLAERLLGVLLDDVQAQGFALQEGEDGQNSERLKMMNDLLVEIREDPLRYPDVGSLAARAGLCVDHFSRIFRSSTGIAPSRALIDARIDRARLLLASSPLSVTAIAEETGYETVSYFSRQFRRETGVTPLVYRQQNGTHAADK